MNPLSPKIKEALKIQGFLADAEDGTWTHTTRMSQDP